MGKFVITTRKSGEFQFNLKAGNGQVILSSEGYSTKTACLNGVESVKKNSQEDARFEKNVAKNGKFYFNLKASNGQVIGNSEMYETEASRENGISNGQVIGNSEMYETEASRENGIKSVKTNAPDAQVDDQTVS